MTVQILKKKQVLIAAFIAEGALLTVWFLWSAYRGSFGEFLPKPADVPAALLFTLPLLVFNFTVFYVLPKKYKRLKVLSDFVDELIKPIARALGPISALVVSLLAAFGEELFFRGLVQKELGIVIASIMFAFLHFGPALRTYAVVASIYVLIGFYFGLLYSLFSLRLPIAVHFFYDYFALLWLQVILRRDAFSPVERDTKAPSAF